MMASTINRTEIMAVERFADRDGSAIASPAALVAPKVEATIEANAATTRSRVSHANTRKSLFAFWPMVSLITTPMDCPLLRTDANSAPKSWTPPKKMPPIRTQSITGIHPKAAAWIGPLIGPAPAMDEK